MMRKLVAAIAIAATALPLPALAGHTSEGLCSVDVDAASAANAQVVDRDGEWFTNLELIEPDYGWVWREGTDIRKAWISRDADGLHATIQVADLAPAEPNVIFRLLFNYPDDNPLPPNKTRRWVSGQIKGFAENVFRYGYLDEGLTGPQYFLEGPTTGSFTPGPNGTVTIDLPAAMGITSGEYLTNIVAETHVILGSPQELPPPSPLRHGFVVASDSTEEDAVTFCSAYVSP